MGLGAYILYNMPGVGEGGFSYNKMFWLSPNPFFASLLQSLYASDDGKLISFLQFSYFSHVLSPFGDPLAKTFDIIANDDLSHAKTLAETIVMLGEKPLPSSKGKLLSLRNIRTETDKASILLTAVELKEKSVINLRTTIAKIDNRYIKNLLTRILNEEVYSLNILNSVIPPP